MTVLAVSAVYDLFVFQRLRFRQALLHLLGKVNEFLPPGVNVYVFSLALVLASLRTPNFLFLPLEVSLSLPAVNGSWIRFCLCVNCVFAFH